jgi:hypothetical protein
MSCLAALHTSALSLAALLTAAAHITVQQASVCRRRLRSSLTRALQQRLAVHHLQQLVRGLTQQQHICTAATAAVTTAVLAMLLACLVAVGCLMLLLLTLLLLLLLAIACYLLVNGAAVLCCPRLTQLQLLLVHLALMMTTTLG